MILWHSVAMSENLDYNTYMRRAMQNMIGDVLADVAEAGLPGDHHFYISFLTPFNGVVIPEHLRAQYPEEMTIVLQEWFEDLGVMDDRFAVTLSFHGKAEQLVIPFAAVTGFADPSVNFNLRFDASEIELDDAADDASEVELSDESASSPVDAQVIQLDSFRKPSG